MVTLGLGLAVRVQASDPGIALAYPVAAAQIQIDGDLADWPAHLPRYPIPTLVLGAAPTDAADCSAWFRLAYCESENVLYAGVEVQDADREEAPVDPLVGFAGETAIVIVRVPDGDGGSPRGPLGFLRTEDLVNEKGERVPIERTVTAYGGGNAIYASPQYFRSAMRRGGDRWWCEYCIDIGGMTAGTRSGSSSCATRGRMAAAVR